MLRITIRETHLVEDTHTLELDESEWMEKGYFDKLSDFKEWIQEHPDQVMISYDHETDTITTHNLDYEIEIEDV